MNHKILIIDDDPQFKKLLELRLKTIVPEAEFIHHDSLATARTFLNANKDAEFDLVVLDQHLGDGRGIKLLEEGFFQNLAVLAVSSDDDPEIPGASMKAGAAFFLSKSKIGEPLFKPLVLGLIDRNRLQKELNNLKLEQTVLETVRTLVGTLRHEINNPLGAVLGAAYILKTHSESHKELGEAAALVESSGKRIKHVLDQLTQAVALESVEKAKQKVFHIPGDKPWGQEE